MRQPCDLQGPTEHWKATDRTYPDGIVAYPLVTMPVTPLHLGVGLLGKGVLPRTVSLTAFAASQVVIDLEVAYYMLMARTWPYHRWGHTFLVGGALGLLVGLAVWLGGAWFVRRAGPRWQVPELHEAALLPAVVGGLLGGLTHPVLDGLMHEGIAPLRPFSTANPFQGVVPYPVLVGSLVAMACVGSVLLAVRLRRLPARSTADPAEATRTTLAG